MFFLWFSDLLWLIEYNGNNYTWKFYEKIEDNSSCPLDSVFRWHMIDSKF